MGSSIRVSVRSGLGFRIRARIRVQIWKYLSTHDRSTKWQPQPNPNPNFTNWEVAKEVYVLLNTKKNCLYLKHDTAGLAFFVKKCVMLSLFPMMLNFIFWDQFLNLQSKLYHGARSDFLKHEFSVPTL